jgi:sulfite reductase (NADPH) flavoprotein alpha-component
LASRRAVLHGWRLRFNVQHFFRHEGGVGNIEPTGNPDDKVLGVLHYCPDESLGSLDAMEACGHGYDRITLDVEIGDEQLSAYTYVGMAEFIKNDCLPTQRYLNLLIEGARSMGLASDFIAHLSTHPVHQPETYPLFTPPAGDYPVFNEVSLHHYPLYTALYGAVFDMSAARPLHAYLKVFFGGRDMTLFDLKRLDSSQGNETIEDIRYGRLNEAHQYYLNCYLNEYAREYRYVGHFDYNVVSNTG